MCSVEAGGPIFFSIIVPTRDRPDLCAKAIDSVLAQTWPDKELVVVDDGSAPEFAAGYARLAEAHDGKVRFVLLPRFNQGLGSALTRNLGVAASSGRFVGFLDDDDCWTDPDHLARAAATLADHPRADLYMADQEAVSAGQVLPRGIWIESLAQHTGTFRPAGNGAFLVNRQDFFRGTQGFAHLNTLLLSRVLFDLAGGFQAGLRYEPDRDLFLRALDRADEMLYCPRVVARHSVPDKTKSANVTTKTTPLQKAVIQLGILDRLITSCGTEVQQYALQHKAYTLKRIAELLHQAGDGRAAFYYAREAMLLSRSWKWGMYTAWLGLRARRQK